MKYYIASVGWSVFIAVLSFMPNDNLPELSLNLLEPDKLAHAFVYGFLALLLWWGSRRSGQITTVSALSSVGISSVYGILIECAQYAFFPYRFFEFYDIIANIIGALLGLFVAFFFYKVNLSVWIFQLPVRHC